MGRSPASEDDARAVLAAYVLSSPSVARLAGGLINDTFAVDTDDARFVLQRVHPVFSPEIHHNIAAVTEHLAAKGVATPRLIPTREGMRWVEREGAVWRLMTRLPGVSRDTVDGDVQARAAGAALGRFHAALLDLEHDFVGLRSGVHDTDRHLADLRDCVARHGDHRLHAAVAPLADEIAAAVAVLPTFDGVPDRIVHGDPKISNILFESATGEGADRAVGLVDLDTVAPMPLHLELGDAWRSWCNRGGEDDGDASFDLGVFAASWAGWSEAMTAPLSSQERAALLHGVEWITVELAARFLADALAESYFGWDADRFDTCGDHNLVRGRGQLALHRRAVACRHERARVLVGRDPS
jgi:Ser/Thr protein kinase RdoA (MazF antagonist)